MSNSLSSVVVDFIAKTAQFTEGLTAMASHTKKWQKDTTAAFDSVKTVIEVLAIGVLFKKLVDGIEATVSSMAKMHDEAAKLGISVEAYQTLSLVAIEVGSNIGALTGAMNKVQKAIDAASDSTSKQGQAFETLNINVTKFKELKPDEQFGVLLDALKNVKDRNEQASLSLLLFGKGVAEIRPFMEEGSAGIAKMRIAGENMGTVLSTSAVQSVKDLEKAITHLKEAGQGQLNILTAAVSEVATEFITKLTPSANEAGGAYKTLSTILTTLETPLWVMVGAAQYLTAAFYGLRSAVYYFGGGALEIYSKIADGFNWVVDQYVDGINIIIAAWNASPLHVGKFIDPIANQTGLKQMAADLKDFGAFAIKQADEDGAKAGKLMAGEWTDAFDKAYNKIKGKVGEMQAAVVGDNNKAPTLTPPDVSGTNITNGGDYNNTNELMQIMMDRGKMFNNLYKEAETYYKYWISEEQTVKQYLSATEVDQLKLVEVQRLHNENLLNGIDYTNALTAANMKLWADTNPLAAQALKLFSGIGDAMATAIANGNGLGDVFKSMLKSVEVLILKYMILTALSAMLGMTNWTAGKAVFDQFSGLNAMNGVKGKATGGPVGANTPYMIGEQGPELFVPSNSGVIVPNNQLGGNSGGTVNQTINVSAGIAQTVRAEMMSMLPMFKKSIQSSIMDTKRRGGAFAAAM